MGAGQPLRCAQDPCHGANSQYSLPGSGMTKAPGFVHGGDSPAQSASPGDGIVHRWQQITRGSSGTSSSQCQMYRWAVSSSLGSTVPLEASPSMLLLHPFPGAAGDGGKILLKTSTLHGKPCSGWGRQ